MWGFCGGVTFVAVFASAGVGVAAHEQGIASGLASSTREVGGAIGPAVLVAVATGHGAPLDGPRRTAGRAIAAVTALGGVLALALPRPAPLPGGTPSAETSARLEGVTE
ncbi:hypothetical protein [Streptomyces sp. CA-253872]|uniref:hypothetical protein n=1 Tax=Streptomyces sp. CA-253872 TaxID=3240067 RepID=UPI003D8F1364